MSWLRRNRWGLILLPVALLTALAASSSRVVHFWWGSGPHEVTSAALGEPVTLSQAWQDRAGRHVREVTVTVRGVAKTATVRDRGEEVAPRLPEGAQLWRVTMALAADPDQVVRGCRVEIVDTIGREFEYGPTLIEPFGILKASPCLNPDQAGPEPVLYEGQSTEIDEPRPPTWETEADVLLPGDATPALVRIYWELPKVIEVPVEPARP